MSELSPSQPGSPDPSVLPRPSVAGGIVRTMRPRQWVKNAFVLLPVVFAKGLLDGPRLVHALLAFVSFCAASSAVYFLNDLVDVEADRAHPTKRHRPIASGVVPPPLARLVSLGLAATSLGLAASLGWPVALVVGAYLVQNLVYTFGLKRVAYLDVLSIALGFELRVLAGMLSIGAELSTYLLAVTFALASFLGFGKRMHELGQGERAEKQRAVLRRYSNGPLRMLLVGNGLITLAIYVMATVNAHNLAYFGTWHLVFTSGFTAFGLFRFGQLVSRTDDAESPTDSMLRDRVFLANIGAWFVTVVVIVYLTHPSSAPSEWPSDAAIQPSASAPP